MQATVHGPQSWMDMTEQLHLCARGFPHSSIGKEPTCNAGDPGSWVGKISWTRGRRATPVFSSFPVGSAGKVAQLCRTLCDPMDYTVHGIFQARILKWVAFPFSVGPSQPRDQTPVLGSFFWGGQEEWNSFHQLKPDVISDPKHFHTLP